MTVIRAVSQGDCVRLAYALYIDALGEIKNAVEKKVRFLCTHTSSLFSEQETFSCNVTFLSVIQALNNSQNRKKDQTY